MKQKRILAFLLSVAMTISLLPTFTLTASAAALFEGGTGTESDPYQIATADQLVSFRDSIKNSNNYGNNFIILTSDISLTDKTFKQVAAVFEFKGTFDGNGYEISGLDISAKGSYQGLFRKNAGTIKNLKASGTVNGNSYDNIGGIVGRNSGTIENCITSITVTGSNYIGGIAGSNSGTIKGCITLGSVTAKQYVGGIAGKNDSGKTISGCLNRGAVSTTYDSGSGQAETGGIVGTNYGTVYGCRNEGDVTGKKARELGGIVGRNDNGTITLCSNTGTVGSSDADARTRGGIVGYNKNAGTISQCYNSGLVYGQWQNIGGIVGWNEKSVVTNCYNAAVVSGTGSPNCMGGIAGRNDDGTVSKCLNIG